MAEDEAKRRAGLGTSDGDDTVFPFERPEDLAELKEIKLRLPVSMHIKLHSLKITDDVTISGAVAEAVEAYLRKLESTG